MRPARILIYFVAFVAANARLAVAGEVQSAVPVVLPPFLVEGQHVDSSIGRIDWIYYRDSDLEILSGCPERETRQFIRNLREQRAALSQFVPEDLLLHTALPTTLILFPKSQKNIIDEQMVKEVEKIPSASGSTGHFRPMDDLRLSDADSSFIFVILDDWQWGWDMRHGYPFGQGSTLFYSPAYLRFLVGARTPALPDWFTVGITRLYETMAFNSPSTGKLSSAWGVPVSSTGNLWRYSEFLADPWTSEASARALRKNSRTARPLLPFQELLVPSIADDKSDAYRHVWESQAELFVRWAFSDRIKDGRARLRKFAEEAAARPVTEDMFRSCFGMTYSDARDALSDFLPGAVSKAQEFAFTAMPADPRPVELREATPAEIHRVKGEWARRTLRVVQSSYPVALPLYASKARQMLEGSYDHGERDPLLIASLALFRIETGDAKGGRQLLEQYPEAGAARPLARLELARLWMIDAAGTPEGGNGSLSERQAGMVLKEVSGVIARPPPIEASYLLAARVSMHLGRNPTDAERALLNDGARLFPRNSQMVMECVSWDIRAHDLALARTLNDLGGYEAVDTAAREKFRLLGNLVVTASEASN
jgi:hypothetical protein